MSLNFKTLRRSFSLRDNVSEDKEDKNPPNLIKESFWLNGTSRINSPIISTTNGKLSPNSLDEIRIIDLKNKAFNRKMEYLMPYVRLKPCATTGMQVTSVKKNESENALDTNKLSTTANIASDVHVSSKKIRKEVMHQVKHLKGSSESEFLPTKMSKKQLKMAQEQLKKLTKINIHLHALFSAVENGQSDRAKSILESTDVNVNCINSDALSPLDVAVLSNNRSLTKILLHHGASHGNKFKNCDSLCNHLNSLLEDALNKINDATFGSADNLGENDVDKQIDFWQRRANSLQRILRGWIQASNPYSPSTVIIDVTSANSVAIRVHESLSGAITTKFKIQWSLTEDFGNIIDEREIHDLTNIQGVMSSTLHLYNLFHGKRYFFRAFSGNMKGWSEQCLSSPRSVIPSSWRDVAKELRTINKQSLDDLLAKVRTFRATTSSDIHLDAPMSQGTTIKKKASIKQLFTATSKFQKHLKRGMYLACLLYHEGKVLVTNDDLLPIIEIDENYPNNVFSELPWLLKVSCNWDIVKSLRNEMERHATPANQFRLKILSAISQMQSATGLRDLGDFYYKLLQDTHGSIVISCVNSIKHPKSISVLNSRWIPLRKINRKLMPITDQSSINDIVLASIQSQIEFHQVASSKLSKGLYIGYLKMHCSMEQMHIMVPMKTPNVLPHCKIRDNPHVCAEEWDVLLETSNQKQVSEMQKRFLDAISTAAKRVFKYMEIPTECMLKHKLYNLELVKLSPDVSFLVICPPVELSCAAPGQREMLLQRADLVSVPTQVFEMCQLFTYNKDKIQKCARLSIVLDSEMAEANHSHRKAFSTLEAQATKERLHQLQELRTELSEFWKSIRWLMDVMTFARNRCSDTGVSMRYILDIGDQENEPIVKKCEELLLPPVYSDNLLARRSPCRLSWPNANRNELKSTERSMSDQQLSYVTSEVNCRRTTDFDALRRNSADAKFSQCFHASEESIDFYVNRFELCKSDETLNTSRSSFSPLLQRKRSNTTNASICSSKCEQCVNAATSTKKDHTNSGESVDKTPAVSYNADHDDRCSTLSKVEFNDVTAVKTDTLKSVDDIGSVNTSQFGTIQVYVANETDDGNANASGTCLRLHVTIATTAREIIELVVNQCNETIILNNEDERIGNKLNSKDLCLFAIFGTRGRCVPDNFRPLKLQNPWKKGRLFVRRTHDILAEIEHSKKDVHVI